MLLHKQTNKPTNLLPHTYMVHHIHTHIHTCIMYVSATHICLKMNCNCNKQPEKQAKKWTNLTWVPRNFCENCLENIFFYTWNLKQHCKIFCGNNNNECIMWQIISIFFIHSLQSFIHCSHTFISVIRSFI